jgi:hypothetical protein
LLSKKSVHKLAACSNNPSKYRFLAKGGGQAALSSATAWAAHSTASLKNQDEEKKH